MDVVFLHGKAVARFGQLFPFHFCQKTHRAQIDAQNRQTIGDGNGICP